ncbi:hypothetical protein DB345_07995 [Spartobacteria bacterium LR76]|nr:hypothetical protein DB345_07995 [Spartobacteria bacterium LR76]
MRQLRGMWGCVAVLVAVSAHARDGTAFTVDALVTSALANNAELKAYEAEVLAAKGQRTQAGFFRNPEVTVEIGGREVRDSENILQGSGTTFSLTVLQTLEFPGKGTLRKAIANKNVEIAELGLEQFRLSLAAQVRLLAYEYLAAASAAKAAEAVYEQSKTVAAQIGSGGDFGARLQLESRLVQASLVELGARIKEASLRAEQARTRLNALLGRPQSLPIRITSSLTPPSATFDRSAVVFAVQNGNPLLQIRRKELERSARELTATRLDIAPDFAIGPFFSRDVAGDTEQNLGGAISATLPVWDWNIGNIQSARARLAMAEALRVKAERDTEAEVLSLIRAYELIRRQLAMIPQGSLSDVEQASALAETQFRNGSIGAQLYLDAQTAYLNSLQASQDAVLDAWRAALDIGLLTGGKLETKEAGR